MLRKEDVCVLIDTPEKAKEALEILENANEFVHGSAKMAIELNTSPEHNILTIIDFSIFNTEDAMFNDYIAWTTIKEPNHKRLISLSDLRKILLPNEGQEERFIL